MSAAVLDLSAKLNASLDGRTPPAPGVYPRVPEFDYHRWDCASNSRLTQLYRSPAHLRAYISEPWHQTEALLLGRASHCAILEPDDFPSRYVLGPDGDRRTKAVKEKWDELEAQFGDGFVLKPEQYRMCLGIRDSLYSHPLAGPLLREVRQTELTVVWRDKRTGLLVKARLDGIAPEIATIVDLKSAEDARERAFTNSVWSYGYHRQGVLYGEGAEANELPVRHHSIIAYEKKPPFAAMVYRLTGGAIDAGGEQLNWLLPRYQQCEETDLWPAYQNDEVVDLALPDYAWDVIDRETKENRRG